MCRFGADQKLAASCHTAFSSTNPRTCAPNTLSLLLFAERDASRMTGGAKGTLMRRDDLLPAYLFGPGHASLSHGVETDGPVGRSHGYHGQVITNEINRQDRLERER